MIEVRDLYKSFNGRDYVLKDINIRVNPGEFVVVLGPSGAGKSTLLRCLNYLSPPTAGEILIHGERCHGQRKAARRALRKRIAMVFQHHNLIGRLSVIKNVLVGRMAGIPLWSCLLQVFRRHDVDIALAAIDEVGMAEKAYARADSLSGGEQQRVGIARALAQQPDLILADEPVASLDPKNSRETLAYLRSVCQKKRIAVLCNLHQIDYAMEYATRIIGLSGGSIVFDGPPEKMNVSVIESIYPGIEDDNVAKLVIRMSGEIRRQKSQVAQVG
ncbi:phosphonate transport system ATP-binding protein [Microbulbifer donghaiensis]|uniref:Phosphonate transport system ATP-binding protein n=1 Tax=Microbulbifer donghaiensis TaxID=494016 RepID=A0A1M5G3Q0_9GAMM|nr:phosphonate ABC transporter ATP-binding protein [Microbulbifer donghaiensis]SHF98339.1 phosphonate transport system ATP-binding protein [Microbulbifer donghaiensis]